MAVTCVACLRLHDVRRRPGQPISRLGENNSSRRESRTGSDRLRLDLWQTNTGNLPLRQSSLPLRPPLFISQRPLIAYCIRESETHHLENVGGPSPGPRERCISALAHTRA